MAGYDKTTLEQRKLLEKAEKELKTEFIPELYDKTMEKMFDEKYYEMEDKEAKKLEKQKQINLKLLNDEEIMEENLEDGVADDKDNSEEIRKSYE